MKKKKYLPLYNEWIKTGQMPWRGLCGSLPDPEDILIFEDSKMVGYWGFNGKNICGCDVWHSERLFNRVVFSFTPIRQNIVLFLAAMNNEL